MIVKKIRLAYGRSNLDIRLPEGLKIEVVEPRYRAGLKDQRGAIAGSLRKPIASSPLSALVKPGHRIGIVFSDITRATPYNLILPALLDELKTVADERIVLFNATGTHRANTREELCQILGEKVVKRFKIIQNDAADEESHTLAGTTARGNRVSILKSFMECDIRILTGFIEPHFFAGFSGGGKAVMPVLDLLETVMRNHNAQNMEHSRARWGITNGNPVWEDVMDAAKLCLPLFLLNVALNRDKEITAVFAGDLEKAHEQGCAFVKEVSMRPVAEPFDIVITSNSGYPLDLNLYQTVKGMSAAAQIVRQGGSIIIASDCWDGIPEHGEYGRLLSQAEDLDSLLAKIRQPGFTIQDSWQAQIHALICKKADVFLYSQNLSDEQIGNAFLKVCRSVEDTLAKLLERYGPEASICILPEGPLTIPYVQETV
ncbi:MAG: nickel-dependent lactate racemase [Spirochaeta sp.]|nr:nickel-dependent lactate racemase [Spirochaeta sp.]